MLLFFHCSGPRSYAVACRVASAARSRPSSGSRSSGLNRVVSFRMHWRLLEPRYMDKAMAWFIPGIQDVIPRDGVIPFHLHSGISAILSFFHQTLPGPHVIGGLWSRSRFQPAVRRTPVHQQGSAQGMYTVHGTWGPELWPICPSMLDQSIVSISCNAPDFNNSREFFLFWLWLHLHLHTGDRWRGWTRDRGLCRNCDDNEPMCRGRSRAPRADRLWPTFHLLHRPLPVFYASVLWSSQGAGWGAEIE